MDSYKSKSSLDLNVIKLSIGPLRRLPAVYSFHVALLGRGRKVQVDESVPIKVGDSVPDGVVMSRSSSSRRSSSLGGTGAILFPRRRRCPGCSCTPSRGQGPRRSRHRCCSDFQIYFISYFNSRVVAVVASSNLKKSPELVLPPSSWCCSRSLGSWRARGSWWGADGFSGPVESPFQFLAKIFSVRRHCCSRLRLLLSAQWHCCLSMTVLPWSDVSDNHCI